MAKKWFGALGILFRNPPYSMGKTVSCRFSLKSIDGISWPRGHHVDVPDLRKILWGSGQVWKSGLPVDPIARIAIPKWIRKEPKKVQGYKLYVYIYIYVCMYIYIYMYTYIYISVCVCTLYMYVCIYMYTYIYISVRVLYICMYIYTHTHTYIIWTAKTQGICGISTSSPKSRTALGVAWHWTGGIGCCLLPFWLGNMYSCINV